ncbi:uncharacterized protein LOC121504880 [Cheilinus undulatus]|uniref:uncharacterized protein LOC121504880 n=1 Tax=Cheilinus undulatus TaxID=241271 RepID=UPI001BD28381|nr:uncharacterized protein LOC121504880 [Cheilinus undulatus]
MITLSVLCVLLYTAYGALLYAEPGQNVTLPCFLNSSINQLSWYKQNAGDPPQIISTIYKLKQTSNKFYNQFKDSKRFSVQTGEGFYHLIISGVQDSDSAMYYCGQTMISHTEFREGIFLVFRGSGVRSYIEQPASDTVKPGGSVTLQCSVRNGTCDGDHSVYWFKKDSGTKNSPSGIIYINSNSSQCGQNPKSEGPEQRCVYSLSKGRVTESDAGTYYCAVAHCGDILFGTGTRLDVDQGKENVLILMYCVAAALLVSIIFNVVLLCILCKTSKRKLLQPEELQTPSSDQIFTADSQTPDLDSLQYVALDFKRVQNKSRRQRSTEEETIYSAVRPST